jgi:hypothetical protein
LNWSLANRNHQQQTWPDVLSFSSSRPIQIYFLNDLSAPCLVRGFSSNFDTCRWKSW